MSNYSKRRLEEAKQKKREEVKGRLLTVDYAILMAQYKAIDDAETLEEVEAICNTIRSYT